MIDDLQLEFDRLAKQAHPAEPLLSRITAGVARRRTRRRRLAATGAALAVAALAGAGLLVPTAVGPHPAPAPAADATPAPTTRDVPNASGSADYSCVAPDYVPDPTPLVAAGVTGAADLELTLLPRGWTRTRSTETFTEYSAPQDPHRNDFFAGRIVVTTGSTEDRPGDFAPTTTIGGHPASISLTDPCSTADLPGQWGITMQMAADQRISIQGPLSLRLTDDQLRGIAASAVVHRYVVGHG